MSIAGQCPECGCDIPAEAPEGLCPVCLIAGVVSGEPESGISPEDAESAAADSDAEEGGLRFGPYTAVRRLGEGGMGIVYLARQQEPIRREVALKVVRPGLDSSQVIARFEAERQTLALMNHPNIARVFDAGAAPDGRPYFVMEYAPGPPITDYCDANRLNNRERLELFRQVCLAVHHAHLKGIIHRDIKPSNVLVTSEDGKPVLKVIDFGIAKAVNQPLAERAYFTQQGLLMGTPEYMSPEQADLGSQEVDAATDIYSLGVLLYELLAGALPLDPGELRSAGYFEILRMIREQEPPALPARIRALGPAAADVARRRRTDVKALEKELRGDLEWIAMRAIEKDRTRRYASASELAADIARYLNDEPVLAGPPSRVYRMKKFVRKNRVLVAAAAAVLACLVGGLAASTTLYFAEQRQREIAERQGYFANLASADALIEGADYASARERLFQCVPRLRGWEWRLLYALSDTSVRTLQATGDAIPLPPSAQFAFHRDSGRVCFNMFRTLHCWDAASWRPTGTYGIFGRILGMSADGARIVARDPLAVNSPLLVVEPSSGRRIATINVQSEAPAAAISPDGRRVAAAGADGAVTVWDADTGRLLFQTPPGERPHSRPRLVFSPDGRRIASSAAGWLRLFDTSTGRLAGSLRSPEVILEMAFRPDGGRMVIADAANRIRIWNPAEGGAPERIWTEVDACAAVAFSPDGSQVVAAARSGAVHVWDAETGTILATLSGMAEHEAAAVAFSPDGALILAGSRRGSIRIWDIRNHGGGSVLKTNTAKLSASPDGARIAVAAGDAGLVLDSSTGRQLHRMPAAGHVTAVNPAGDRLAFGNAKGEVAIFDTRTGAPLKSWTAHNGAVTSLAFSPDGRHIATSSDDKTAKLWDAVTGKGVAAVTQPEEINVVAFSPDGRYFATAAGGFSRPVPGGAVSLWEAPSGKRARRFSPEWDWGEIVRAIAFSPDGRRLAAGEYASGAIRVHQVSTGELVGSLKGHSSEVSALAFSPDGRLIASGSQDGTIRLWDAARFELLFVIRRPASPVTSLLFGAGGGRLFATYLDGSLRMWSTGTAYPAGATELVTSLLARYRLWADVREHLRTDRTLPGAERRAALLLSSEQADMSTAGGNELYRPLMQPAGRSVDPRILLRRSEDFYAARPWSLLAASFLGGARYRNGLYREAVEILERASAASPDDPIADAFLAMAYACTAQRENARKALDRARVLLKQVDEVTRRDVEPLVREAEAVVRP